MDSDSSNVDFLFDRFCRYRRYLLRACCSLLAKEFLEELEDDNSLEEARTAPRIARTSSLVVLAAILITSRDN